MYFGKLNMEQPQKKMYDSWTDDEVQALLSIYADEEIQRELESPTRNDKVYAKISNKLGELNIVHTGRQCREKLKKLKQDYKKIKDHNNKSGSDRRTSKWFDRLDAVLGHRPSFSGTAGTKDSASVLLEAMVDSNPVNQSIEDETDGHIEQQVAETSVFSPATTSSPRPMCPAEANKRRGKRQRDAEFFDNLRDMEEASRAVQQRGQEQHDRYMQMQLESQAEEREMRRQELAVVEQQSERRLESERQANRHLKDFQDGVLSVLGQLVQSMNQRPPQ